MDGAKEAIVDIQEFRRDADVAGIELESLQNVVEQTELELIKKRVEDQLIESHIEFKQQELERAEQRLKEANTALSASEQELIQKQNELELYRQQRRYKEKEKEQQFPKVRNEYLDTVKLNMDFMMKMFKSARQRVYEYCLENGTLNQLEAAMINDGSGRDGNGSNSNSMDVDVETGDIADDEEYIALKRDLEEKKRIKEQLLGQNEAMKSKLNSFPEQIENYKRFLNEMKARMVELERTKPRRTPLEAAVWSEFKKRFMTVRSYLRGVIKFTRVLKVTAERMKRQRAASKAEND